MVGITFKCSNSAFVVHGSFGTIVDECKSIPECAPFILFRSNILVSFTASLNDSHDRSLSFCIGASVQMCSVRFLSLSQATKIRSKNCDPEDGELFGDP